ncbi:MAG: response regulator transcription factor [Chloroflexota bacterium]
MIETTPKTVRLYVVEEQEIYRVIYQSIFPGAAPLELLGTSANGNSGAIRAKLSALKPDVLLMSTKRLDPSIIEELEQVRASHPRMGLAILLMAYSHEDIEQLRKLALNGEGGMALFLKQSLDQIEQLYGIILAVNQGQIILDPVLAQCLFAEKPTSPFLKQLTARELEILGLLSRGYTNTSIAETLYIDIKTVERHINAMYGKLRADADFNNRHPRVNAARLYLETTGELVSSAPQATLASHHTR